MPRRDLLGLGGLLREGKCSWGEDGACAPSHPLQEVGQSRRGSEVSLDNPLSPPSPPPPGPLHSTPPPAVVWCKLGSSAPSPCQGGATCPPP